MSLDSYTKEERLSNRKKYIIAMFINSVSFNMIAANIVTIYLIRFGAKEDIGGLVAGFPFLSLIFVFFAKFFIKKIGLVKSFGYFWFGRYIAIIPMVLTPALYYFKLINENGVIKVSIFSMFMFQMIRGIAIGAQPPLLNEISNGPGKGRYLSSVQIIVQLSILIVGFITAFFLGRFPGLLTYFIFYILGFAIGILTSILILRLKEPNKIDGNKENSFKETFQNILKNKNTCVYFLFLFLMLFVFNMAKPFIIYYASRIYELNDGTVIYLTIIYNFGGILLGLLISVFIDKTGEKPALVLGGAMSLLPFGILMITGKLEHKSEYMPLLILCFFLVGSSEMATNIGLNKYLFSITEKENMVNTTMISSFVNGFAGGTGSYLGGFLILQIEKTFSSMQVVNTYRLFFFMVFFLTFIPLFVLSKLKRLGKISSRDALLLFINPGNISTMNFLRKLENENDMEEELGVLKKLAKGNYSLSKEEIAHKLNSPFASIKIGAIEALSHVKIDKSDTYIKKLLAQELSNKNEIVMLKLIDIIKRNDLKEYIKEVLEVFKSEENKFIKAEIIRCIGRIGDKNDFEVVKQQLENEKDEIVILYTIKEMERHLDNKNIHYLIQIAKRSEIKEYLVNEIAFVLSKYYGFSDLFYVYYNKFVKEEEEQVFLDLFAEHKNKVELQNIYNCIKEKNEEEFAVEINKLPKITDLEPFLDKNIYKHEIFKLFIFLFYTKSKSS